MYWSSMHWRSFVVDVGGSTVLLSILLYFILNIIIILIS